MLLWVAVWLEHWNFKIGLQIIRNMLPAYVFFQLAYNFVTWSCSVWKKISFVLKRNVEKLVNLFPVLSVNILELSFNKLSTDVTQPIENH